MARGYGLEDSEIHENICGSKLLFSEYQINEICTFVIGTIEKNRIHIYDGKRVKILAGKA